VHLTLARDFALASGSHLEPYLRFGYDEQDTSGGAVSASQGNQALRWHPNTDGGRTSVGLGVNWQLNASQQFHLDYEGSWGSRYDVPWALNAGWRVRF
jgi:outer membrane autotransporter protein